MEFKVGDKVMYKDDINYPDLNGVHGTISKIEDDTVWCENWSDGENGSADVDEIELVKRGNGKTPKINFLFKYDLDEDPIEEFETMKEVDERIKKLSERSDLKKDSIVIYEIKNKFEVKISTKITKKKLK